MLCSCVTGSPPDSASKNRSLTDSKAAFIEAAIRSGRMSSRLGAEIPRDRFGEHRLELYVARAHLHLQRGIGHDDLLAELVVLVGRLHAPHELTERVDGRRARRPLVEHSLQLVEDSRSRRRTGCPPCCRSRRRSSGERRPPPRRSRRAWSRRSRARRTAAARRAAIVSRVCCFLRSRRPSFGGGVSSELIDAERYHQTFTDGNFAMSVDFRLQRRI